MQKEASQQHYNSNICTRERGAGYHLGGLLSGSLVFSGLKRHKTRHKAKG